MVTPKMVNYQKGVPFVQLGLDWYNEQFTNNCNVDSWLTFLKIVSFKHPNQILQNMRLGTCQVEDTIREIVQSYQVVKDNPVLYQARDAFARMVWYQNAIGHRLVQGVQMDMAAAEEDSVFQHLFRSTIFQWSYSCCCGYQYLNEHWFSIKTGEELRDVTRSFDPVCGPWYNKNCKTCKTRLAYKRVLLSDTTWLLRAMLQKTQGVPMHLERLPIHMTFDTEIFKLAYISYSNPAGGGAYHQTSCHLIQDQWFHYDGLNFRGQLRKVDGPNLPANFEPLNVIYYKIHSNSPKIKQP